MVTTLGVLVLSLSVPWLRDLFGFAPLSLPRLAEAVGAAVGSVVVNEAIKLSWRVVARRYWPTHPGRTGSHGS